MAKSVDVFVAESVRVSTTSNAVRVFGEDRGDIAVYGTASAELVDGVLTVHAARSRLEIRVPVDTDLVVGSTSARVDLLGELGRVAVVTRSGRISVASARQLDARSDSGRIEVGMVTGNCRAQNRTGRISIDACTGADVTTDSGRIELHHVSGPVRAHCVSGRITIGLDVAADVDAETVSGSIRVSLPTGTQVGDDCAVDARSVSGRITVSNR
jgi:DUF4097 and DUF4098 domain-containing protein YvlB